jgi:hypothetical protein
MPLILIVDPLFFGVFQAGILLTYWVNPDADLVQKLGVLGEIIGLEDYEGIMPHRHGLYLSQWRERPWMALLGSHTPLTGTFVRLLPILVPLSLLMLLPGGTRLWPLFVAFLLGASWSDLWHVIADVVVSKGKKIRRDLI